MTYIFVNVIYGCNQNSFMNEKVGIVFLEKDKYKLGANGIHSVEGTSCTCKKIGG